MPPTIRNRWSVVIGAILIQLALGAIYAWSVFTPSLTQDPYLLSKTQTQTIFSVGLAVFALAMIVTGRIQTKFKPGSVASTGGLILGLGYIMAKFVGTSYFGLLATLGVMAGAGIGIAYVVPIAVGVKWFPDKKGLVTGLSVAGFGFGALLWVKLAGPWFHLIDHYGVAQVFLIYGITYVVMTALGARFLANPPEGYKPAGWNPPPPTANKATGSVEFEPSRMLKTPQYYMICYGFAAGAMAGLMVIGVIALFGMDALKSTGMDEMQAKNVSGTAMGIFFALANGFGRILWGMISDKIGRKASLVVNLGVQGLIMLSFYQLAFKPEFFYLGATLIGFNFGGLFALFPSITADFFGNKTLGLNYGWVFASYGIGGIIGPILGGRFGDAAKTSGDITAWATPFMIAGIVCLVAAVILALLRPPRAVQKA